MIRPKQKVILTIDDLGPDPVAVERALELFARGRVTRGSVIVNIPWAPPLRSKLLDSGIPLGLHINITSGPPVADPDLVPSLLGPDGFFHEKNRSRNLAHVAKDEFTREVEAQLGKFREMGFHLSHMDNHRPEIYFAPALFQVCIKLASRNHVTLRHPLEDITRDYLKKLSETFQMPESELLQLKAAIDREFTEHNIRSTGRFFTDGYPGGLAQLFQDIKREPVAEAIEIAVHLQQESGKASFDFLASDHFADSEFEQNL